MCLVSCGYIKGQGGGKEPFTSGNVLPGVSAAGVEGANSSQTSLLSPRLIQESSVLRPEPCFNVHRTKYGRRGVQE